MTEPHSPFRPTGSRNPTTGRRITGGLRRWATAAVGTLALTAGLLAAAPQASAAGLTQVTGFGSNPGNLSMYTYAPDTLPSDAPLVIALHGCTQSATDYYSNSGWPKFADSYGFALVFPQTSSANNANSCFNWFQTGDSARGQGEALSIKQMVDKAVAQYGSDTRRVYITGLSAGAGMTANMLAAYPDVFAGGSIDSGLPAGCATSVSAAYTCMYSPADKTPAQWGDLVRSAAPAGTTSWPRVAIWQGTADTTVAPANATELRDQWTNAWGIGQTPSRTESLGAGTTLSVYDDTAGKPAVEVYSIAGMQHGLAVDPGSGAEQCGTAGTYYLDTICSSYHTARFWGLDGGGGETPGTLPAPTGLTVSGTTDTTASLKWNAVDGAASYTVYRGGSKVGTAASGSYTDTGLNTGTAYTYTVAAVDTAGATGTVSASVTATTTGFTPTCYTASNYQHTVAGRAHQSGGNTYANGSDEAMGLWNTFTTHTLKQTAPDYYVLADSGCTA
ncbi:extracellular catalytic domain type 1 short-chain-length polyhydroxyalkanoate depolymerase [Streptomyces longispororuber]|uniref:extracellular catalytic domain type 1 short-chain-length polyhydroxyalkanoate depolymerase n=1 Tax=Streptomyces longispororuber TaxID=68230 RepID=UPI002109971F|nr:PHB depolymerase family esterase [Streptomyces longispororuber]MCQ4208350.1 PHB depolymerase family esterase [Streptomyces longispororuber]